MELFTVNRYTALEATAAKHDGNKILTNLLKKAKNKKDSAKKAIQTNLTKDEQEQQKEPINITSEAKKRKLENENEASKMELDKEDESAGYEVLGEDVTTVSRKLRPVDFVLPSWLANPTIMSNCLNNDNATKNELSMTEKYPYLASHIIQSLKELKIEHLFPVQNTVIPYILDAHTKPPPFRPRDICVSAPTGSGKTLAFAIPVVQLLSSTRVDCKVRALVVLPVAELATQIYGVFKKLCEKTDLRVLLFSNRTTFATEQENLVEYYKGVYYSKADIIVTTPGRLVDHLHGTKGFCLKNLKFLIIDEADRIMDAVFQNWYYHLDTHVHDASDQLLSGRAAPLCLNGLELSAGKEPHKLLFSATLSQDPEKLQSIRLFQPKLFSSVMSGTKMENLHFTWAAIANGPVKNENDDSATKRSGEFIGKYTTPAELSEKYCLTESSLKPLTLSTLIQEQGWKKFLCFTNSTDAANRLTILLQKLVDNVPFFELSGSMHRNQREKCLNAFKGKGAAGLITTDAMARGIDVEVDIVISYDPPRHIKTYIHRIGRTARAGRPGTAVTLLTQSEQKHFNHILSEVGKSVTDEITVSNTSEEKRAKEYADALTKLRNQLETDKRMKILAKRRAKMATIHPTDPETMTLMQKLQHAVDNVVVKQTNAVEKKKKRRQEKQNRKTKKGTRTK